MLTIERLSKTYSDGKRALSDIELDVRRGEIVAIVGGSGCGKTTLMRLVAGLDRPSAGTIAIDGEPVVDPHPKIGVVFQEPRLLPWLTVAQNVAFGLLRRPAGERDGAVADALERVGLAEHADRLPRDLSGGQQQRVAIARAFAAGPEVLLLDEPFSALDAFTRADLHGHLLALWKAAGLTIVIVTHDVAEAVMLADRVVVMRPDPGRVHDEIEVLLARPRERTSPGVEAVSRTLYAALDEARRPAARETDQEAVGLWW
ncbi:ABC transporter ATP-binding protein [Salinarimonas ramus]|uniref:Nitrate/sulfonate/bicarbonate ABC transporter ATP-binding protein n=1 Tax=Salinarimonas ramus TaxID=690164 RepID=A0A917V214_9HYPH|nr:ABC transporter ATP-binding protein [Salinarimonas ramus]GGK20105.1 nitrate/sulfonate/bicarbonate ABC transporter ATP-binding protein [Salinarimonas ramus]